MNVKASDGRSFAFEGSNMRIYFGCSPSVLKRGFSLILHNADSRFSTGSLITKSPKRETKMKSIYVFTRDSEKFTCETVVFRVFVGKSRREQVRASLLECFCNDMGYFWRIQDTDTDFWLETKAKEIRPTSAVPLLHVKRASVNVCTLYRMIMDGELEAFEANLPISNSLYKVISICDCQYFAEHIFSAKPSPRPELTRKYLNRSNWSEGKKAVLCSAGVFLLLVLDALFSILTGL